MSVNRYWMPVIVISVLLGTVLGTQALGWWSISGRTSVNLDSLSPEDIKGWMTLQQVADGMNLSIENLYKIGGIPTDVSPETALKDMEEVVEVSALREALTAYAAGEQPAQTVETTPEPEVTEKASTTGEHTGDGTGPTPLPPGEVLPADQIKGRMTLREISDQCAVDLDALLAALNLPPDTDPDTQLKTLTQEGVLEEVTQVQDAVALLQK
jgi:hypothetical protein